MAMTSSLDLASLQTRGIKQNRTGIFTLQLTGEDVYGLLQLLEERAAPQGKYLEVKQSVYFAEHVREQVRGQGF